MYAVMGDASPCQLYMILTPLQARSSGLAFRAHLELEQNSLKPFEMLDHGQKVFYTHT